LESFPRSEHYRLLCDRAGRWTARGTSKGSFLMLPPTDDAVEYTGVSMYCIGAGKIAEIWETYNTLSIMLQLNSNLE
jgi:predicted ester cyclase